MNLDRIPSELKRRPQWVLWRIEERDGKPTKIPYNPKDPSVKAEANNPDTWGEYWQAAKYWQAHKDNGVAGIGYEFGFYDPYCGIDLDKCRDPETGEIEAWATDIIKRLSSYTEVSPSGRGVHVLIKGKLPPEGRRKEVQKELKAKDGLKREIEMYDVGRYFTITGQHLEGTPTGIEARQAELEALHREIFGQERKDTPRPAGPSSTLELSDRELIEKASAARNGEKFSRLWGGNWQGQYPSQSEATAALLNALVFYCGNDPARVDRLFRQSGLMREKWDRPTSGSTWGALEIQKAISRATEFYNSGRRSRAPDADRGDGSGQAEEAHKPGTEPQDTPGADPTASLIPVWPQEVMTGVAGAFAKTYANYLETPASFLFMDFLTILGHLLSDKVTLRSEISPQPRLYLVNLGESADTRKSTSIFKTVSFFRETIDPDDLNLIMGVGSAEGLAKALGKNPRGVLINDELKQLVNKMRIDASVLLPCVCTLFELNTYRNQTQKHDIKIDDAQLCLLGASTLDTFQNMFSEQFLSIGLINRLFIVIGDSERKFAIPQPIPEAEKNSIRQDLRTVLNFWADMTAGGRFELPIDSLALDIFENWYFSLEQSVFTKRLDTYGHRVMVLLAVNGMQQSITPEIAEKTVVLLNYQLAARKFADPIDADNAVARIEERIRRALVGGKPWKKRDLERTCHKNRVGTWAWNTAIKNLREGNEVGYDHKRKMYWLMPE